MSRQWRSSACASRTSARRCRSAQKIAHPLPLVRYQARKAINALLGRDCGIDLDRSLPDIIAATEKCVPQAAPITPGPSVRETPASHHDDD